MKRIVCKVEDGDVAVEIGVQVQDRLGVKGVEVAIVQAADQVLRLYKDRVHDGQH